MLIFGTRRVTKRLATILLVCSRCGRPAANHVTTTKLWFTLFFIPIFPISVKRRLVCTFCGGAVAIDKATAQQYVAQQQVQAQPVGQQSAPQYAPQYAPQHGNQTAAQAFPAYPAPAGAYRPPPVGAYPPPPVAPPAFPPPPAPPSD